MRVRILHVPGCPNLPVLRALLDECLRRAGRAAIVETVAGSHPSPTLIIGGVDVITGRPPGDRACCRLDLPTPQQITAALMKGTSE